MHFVTRLLQTNDDHGNVSSSQLSSTQQDSSELREQPSTNYLSIPTNNPRNVRGRGLKLSSSLINHPLKCAKRLGNVPIIYEVNRLYPHCINHNHPSAFKLYSFGTDPPSLRSIPTPSYKTHIRWATASATIHYGTTSSSPSSPVS